MEGARPRGLPRDGEDKGKPPGDSRVPGSHAHGRPPWREAPERITPRDTRLVTRGPTGLCRSTRGPGVCRVFADRRARRLTDLPQGPVCDGRRSHYAARATHLPPV